MTERINVEEIECKELTGGQVREVMTYDPPKSINGLSQIQIINSLIPDGVDVKAIMLSTGIDEKDLIEFKPSELEILQKRVGEKNPFFLTMLENMAVLTKEMQLGATT